MYQGKSKWRIEKEKEVDNNGCYTGKWIYTPLPNIFDGIDLFKNQQKDRTIQNRTEL